MTQTESDPSIWDTWTENPGATAAAIGLGLLLGLGAAVGGEQLLMQPLTGDEPPIRVRNGTVYLDVIHASRGWRQTGNHWQITQSRRSTDSYRMYLAPTDPAHCGNTVAVSGNEIRLTLSDDTQAAPSWIQIKSVGRVSQVTSSKSLTRSDDEQTLSYGAAGIYVMRIVVDGTERCNFPAQDVKFESVLTE